jgi:two-component system, response regulator
VTDRPILLVEDNPDDLSLTLQALKKNNILNEITVARNGVEALQAVFGDNGAARTLPGLILLDLKLPRVDGLEVLRRIRGDERTKVIPVVILTSSKLEEDILALVSLAGWISYLTSATQWLSGRITRKA